MDGSFQSVAVEPLRPARGDIASGAIAVVDLTAVAVTVAKVLAKKDGWRIVSLQRQDIPHSGDSDDLLGNEVREAISRMVEAQELGGTRAAILLPDELIVHELVSLPRMSVKDRERVFGRKLEEKCEEKADHLSWGSILMERGGEAGASRTQKESWLLAACVRKRLFRLHEHLRRAGLVPTWMVPVPACQLALIETIRPRSEGATWGLLDLDGDHATLTIQTGSHIALLRTIRFRRRPGEDSSAPAIAAEMHRSLLYYQQRFPGEAVERIVVSTHHREFADQVSTALAATLDQDVFQLDPQQLLAAADPPPDLQSTPNLSRIVGFLAESTSDRRLNLNPPEIRTKKVQLTATAAVFLLLVVGGIAAHFFTLQMPTMTEDTLRLVRETEQRTTALEEVLEAHAKMLDRARDLRSLLEAYEKLTSSDVNWISFFHQVSAIPRTQVRLQKIILARRRETDSGGGPEEPWFAELTCLAQGSFVEAQSLVREASSVLRDRPLFQRVAVDPAGAPRSTAGGEQLTPFSIECRLERVPPPSKESKR